MISKRQFTILATLNRNPKLTPKALATSINISTKTVDTDLQAIKQLLAKHHVWINKRPNEQFEINSLENLSIFLTKVRYEVCISLNKSLLIYLILLKGYTTLQEIADHHYVSKSLVEKKLATLKRQYPQIQATRKQGVIITGDEYTIRQYFIEKIMQNLTTYDYVRNLEEFLRANEFEYHQEILVKAAELIAIVTKKEVPNLVDESIKHYFLYIFITLHRNHHNHQLTKTKITTKNPQLKAAQTVIAGSVSLQKAELIQLAQELLGLRHHLRHQHNADNKEQKLVTALLNHVYDDIGIDYRGDLLLFEALVWHTSSLKYRHTGKSSYRDYDWDHFEKEYVQAYESAISGREFLCQTILVSFSRIDTIYLALHFQSALERMEVKQPKVKVVIVCQYGMAASSIIAAKLSKVLTNIDIVDMISVREFVCNQKRFTNIDVIISTEKLPDILTNQREVTYVSPLISTDEIKRISLKITKIQNQRVGKLMGKICFWQAPTQDPNSIIKRIGAKLERQNIITSDYIESVLKREQLGILTVGKIAFPHGNPQFVVQDKIIIIRPLNEIIWGGEKICLIIWGLFSQKMVQNKGVKAFYRLFADETFAAAIAEISGDNQDVERKIRQKIEEKWSNQDE